MKTGLSRKGIAVIVFLAASLIIFSSTAFAAEKMIFSGYGGLWEKALKEYVIRPFEKKFNARVILDTTGNSAAKLSKLRATRGSYTWDAGILVEVDATAGGKDGLLEHLDQNKIPNIKDLYPQAQTLTGGYGPVVAFDHLGLLYNTKHVKPAPDSWRVFWDPQYNGKVAISHPTEYKGLYILLIAAKLNGGDQYHIEKGFELIRKLVPSVGAWITSSAHYVPYLEREEVWLAPYWNGRGQTLVDKGLPVQLTVPKEGTIPIANCWVVPKTAKNKKLAYEFINFYLDVAQQTAWATHMHYGPTNMNVRLSPDVASRTIYGREQIDNLIFLDMDHVFKTRPEWVEKWNKEIHKAAK